jgi:hypothetical protein
LHYSLLIFHLGGDSISEIKVLEGEQVDFEVVKEDWNIYKLKDGTTLKIKLILVGVLRSNNQYDPLGNPIYAVNSTNVVRVIDVPKELKRKPQAKVTV